MSAKKRCSINNLGEVGAMITASHLFSGKGVTGYYISMPLGECQSLSMLMCCIKDKQEVEEGRRTAAEAKTCKLVTS